VLRPVVIALLPLSISSAAFAESDHPNLELGAHAGVAVPHCFDRCADGVHNGPTFGGFVLIRPAHWGAIGLSADVARFGWEARDSDFVDRESSATASFVGLTGRYYPYDARLFGFYAQAALGVAFVDSPSGTLVCKQPAGAALQLSAGYQTHLTSWLRVSSSIAGVIARPSSACEDTTVKDIPPPTPLVTPALMLRIGFTFGARVQSQDEELEGE
jgi:hypothetical protein